MTTRANPVQSSISAIAGADAQLRYASVLAWGTRLGFVALVAAFFVYVFGVMDPHVAHVDLPRLWSQPVGHYLRETGLPTGWGWTALLHRGDIVNLLGIAVLAGCSVPALLAAIPAYARSGDRVFVALCGLQVLVLVLAASNVLAVGH